MKVVTAAAVLFARVRAFFDSRRLDRDLDRELESHLAMQEDEFVAGGMLPDEARRAARIRLGGAASIVGQHRDARGLPGLTALLEDLRFAWRAIARDRAFAATAVAVLALGIGANATGFTVVNAAYFRPLPFPDADRLHMVWWERGPNRTADASYAELEEWRAATTTFDLAAYGETMIDVSDDRALPERVQAAVLTANALEILGQAPALGRGFEARDERPGAAPALILGSRLWRDRYGADPGVLGRTMRVDGRPATIVGVMPDGFEFPWRARLWQAFVPAGDRRDARLLSVVGRLRDGATAAQAQAEFDGIGARMKTADPDATREFSGITIETMTEAFVGGTMPTMIAAIMTGVGLVLLIACANVANLLLSRSDVRARDIALRMTIGAPRRRIVRQLLCESLWLAAGGGAIGLGLAVLASARFERAMQVSGKPYWMVFSIDPVVFGYVAVVCAATAILFGLAPALHLSRADNHRILKEGGRGAFGSRRLRSFGAAVVVTQVTMTIVLLGGGALIVRSVLNLSRADPGIDTQHLAALEIELPPERYPTPEFRRGFVERLDARLQGVRGIDELTWTTGVPPLDGGERLVEVEPGGAVGAPGFSSVVAIGPRFFDVVHRPLPAGRPFGALDGEPGAEVAIVNQRFVDEFMPGAAPIGRRFRFAVRNPAPGRTPEPWRTVVGVSAPIRHGSPQDLYLGPVAYVPYREEAPPAVSILARSAEPPSAVLDLVAREVQTIDPDLPVVSGRTVEEVAAADRWPFVVFGGLFGMLALLALALSSVGLYAVTARAVTRRTQEFGVRMAVGATRGHVSWLVFRDGLRRLAVALPLGLAGAVALGTVLRSLLAGLEPADPLTLFGITAILVAVSIAACLIPAWRATRVEPAAVLRGD